ncbi:GGDEF domain-containing protein [Rhizobium mesoamericanum]|uniref:GGDEF domain-containing protein n=1 Tax=Rhizobium mesoamericanum TaxID=1079800 RepID=UPI0003FD2586|nr:GGDEF domain-containing protein [Rhizobium mesoamericanum]
MNFHIRPHQAAILPHLKIAALGALACAVGVISVDGILSLLLPERLLWVELTVAASISAAVAFSLLLAICLSNEALRKIDKQLQHALCHDPVTGALSANAFAASVEHAIDRRRANGAESPDGIILVLRVGNFDAIRRSYGPQWADTLLQSLIRIVRSSVRYDDLVAQLASDELGIYLPGTTTENTKDICERIRARVHETTFAGGREHHISVMVRLGGTRVKDRDDFLALREAANRAALVEEEFGPLLFRELFS